MKRRLTALFILASALAAGGAGVATTAKQPVATASAYGITVVVPGQPGASAAAAALPGAEATGSADVFTFPADGSIVRTGGLSSSVAAQPSAPPRAQAVSDVLGVALFNGEITFDSVAARATSADASMYAGTLPAPLTATIVGSGIWSLVP